MKTPSDSNPRYGLGVWLQGEYIPRRGFGRPGQMLGAIRLPVDEQALMGRQARLRLAPPKSELPPLERESPLPS